MVSRKKPPSDCNLKAAQEKINLMRLYIADWRLSTMSKDELIVRLVFENIDLRDENMNLKKRLAKSIPVTKEYQIGDLAAILKNVVEGNSR